MMMSVGHCTQRKPRLCGDPRLVVPFVPKLLTHQIYLLFKMVDVNTEAPRCNGSKERSDCKKSWDAVAISPALTIRRTTQPRVLATAEVSPLISLATETRASWGTFQTHCGTFQHRCGYLGRDADFT